MKQKYEGYKINSTVYAISEYLTTDGKDSFHYAIFPAKVDNISFNYNKDTKKVDCSYWLKTPNGQDWGDVVDSDKVSDDFYTLVEKLKIVWHENADTF